MQPARERRLSRDAGEFYRSIPAEFTTTYNALRFGGHTEVAPRLSALLDRLEHSELERAGR